MAKYGYSCGCGWKLKRMGKTRPMYALAKEGHAATCKPLRDELARGGKVVKELEVTV